MAGADSAARFKRGMRAVYDRAAERYERQIMPSFRSIGGRVLDLAAPLPGERHLDLATGTGLVPRLLERCHDGDAGRRTIDQGHLRRSSSVVHRRVVGLDLSASMLRRARLGVSTARLVQADLEWLPLRAGVAEVATLVLALHHLPDPHAALAEARRALRPGGRLAVAAWAKEHSALWQAFDGWFEEAGLGESRPIQQSGRPIGAPDALRAALKEAGFEECEVIRERAPLRFPDLAAFWEWRISFAATNRALSRLSPEELARRRADCLAALAPLSGPGEARADQDVMYAIAR